MKCRFKVNYSFAAFTHQTINCASEALLVVPVKQPHFAALHLLGPKRVWLTRFYAFGIAILLLTLVCPLPSESTWPPGIADPGSDGLHPINRPVETIDVHVNEVNLVLRVTEHNGKFVNNLRPSDLTILDNGVEQTKLTFFKRETDLPIKIALVLDISASMAQQHHAENAAIGSFLKKVSLPLDSVMLFAFNQNVQLRTPVTNNWDVTARLVKCLKPGGQTALYDAVFERRGRHLLSEREGGQCQRRRGQAGCGDTKTSGRSHRWCLSRVSGTPHDRWCIRRDTARTAQPIRTCL